MIAPLYILHYFAAEAPDLNYYGDELEGQHNTVAHVRPFHVAMRAGWLHCVSFEVAAELGAYGRVHVLLAALFNSMILAPGDRQMQNLSGSLTLRCAVSCLSHKCDVTNYRRVSLILALRDAAVYFAPSDAVY